MGARRAAAGPVDPAGAVVAGGDGIFAGPDLSVALLLVSITVVVERAVSAVRREEPGLGGVGVSVVIVAIAGVRGGVVASRAARALATDGAVAVAVEVVVVGRAVLRCAGALPSAIPECNGVLFFT